MRQSKAVEKARSVDRAAMFGVSKGRSEDGGWGESADKFILDLAGVTSANRYADVCWRMLTYADVC